MIPPLSTPGKASWCGAGVQSATTSPSCSQLGPAWLLMRKPFAFAGPQPKHWCSGANLSCGLGSMGRIVTSGIRMSLTRFQSRALEQAAGETAAPRVHVVTFGCQMNKYDSLLAEGRFRRRGYVTTESPDDADVILFNTCSVREHAEERVYSWLGSIQHAKQARPDLVIGVMGCMAERVEGELFRRAKHVDIVCGTRQFQHLPELVDEIRARRAGGGRY